MKFENYPITKEIRKSLEESGFKKPTDIQFKAIPSILRGEDVLAIAQTGTGKTAAFVIPVLNILQTIPKEPEDTIRCLVMVPTRELAMQITEVFHQFGKYTPVKTVSVFGGVEQDPQILKLQKGADILVATPGRMFDLVYQGHIKLTRISILILDEADHMLDLGFNKDIKDVIKFLPKKHQTLFFSATINPKIKDLAYELVKNPIRIQISPKDPVSKNIDHSVAFIEMDDKRFFLERFIKDRPDSKILVFVRTKVRAERVNKAMDKVGVMSDVMHGGKEQQDRIGVMSQFKNNEVKVLITTDVNARGIDIPNVDFVVNYDLPEDPENYVHRVGRTGRGMNRGIAISFCSKEEKEILKRIQDFLTKEIKVLTITRSEYDATIDMTDDTDNDNWRKLIRDAEKGDVKKVKKKKK